MRNPRKGGEGEARRYNSTYRGASQDAVPVAALTALRNSAVTRALQRACLQGWTRALRAIFSNY